MNHSPDNNPLPKGVNPADLFRQGMLADTCDGDLRHLFNAPSIEELAPVFPGLELIELVGEGGMGAVYKARQQELDRMIALKILPEEIGGDAAFAGQFAREARALAKLAHPNIVAIHEFGSKGGLYYIVMEYVDGPNLRHIMERGLINPKEALDIVPQICDALQYAHDRGIVHRDIKPENILINRDGMVKVADFGLVKLMPGQRTAATGEGAVQADSSATIMSRDGRVMGTPAYMAPEQMDGPALVDNRADIYALGVVFYQMLTGELPGKPISSSSRKALEASRLDQIVLKALEQNLEKRYRQASVMKTDMETKALGGSLFSRSHRVVWGGLAGVVAGVALGLLPVFHQSAIMACLLVAGVVLVAWSVKHYRQVRTMNVGHEASTVGASRSFASFRRVAFGGLIGVGSGSALGLVPVLHHPVVIVLLLVAGAILWAAALIIHQPTQPS